MFVAFTGLIAVGATAAAYQAPSLNALGTVSLLGFIALPTLPMIRRRWAISFLIGLLLLVLVALILYMAFTARTDPQAVGRAIWAFFVTELSLCYFWRRRWWFGHPPDSPVPTHSPAGLWKSVAECFVIALAAGLLLAALVPFVDALLRPNA